MTPKQLVVKNLCETAITRIDAAILNVDRGTGLPLPVLQKVRREVVSMRDVLDPKVFAPGYGRALLDWEDERNGLVDFLIEVKYHYDRLRT